MTTPAFFYGELQKHGVDFFTGVPDSLLKDFCAYIADTAPQSSHITAVNEGAAMALAAGHHLAANRIPLVYMQNSGIGNAVNPLLSLCDTDVYRIPALLLIGWRGEPGVHDEPQHITQGRLTLPLLETLNIPYLIMENTEDKLRSQLDTTFSTLKTRGTPFALVVRKGTFAPYKTERRGEEPSMSREAAIEEIMLASPDSLFFSTTGMASRELYELREKHNMGHDKDFLTVGSMGHASSIALAAALARPGVKITCLDGDGAALMHLGAFASIGALKPRNMRHIVLNNKAHDSVGGQTVAAPGADLPAIARACGYERVICAGSRENLRIALRQEQDERLTFIEARVKRGARADLGRPKTSPAENKTAFMKNFNNITEAL
ncbi:MAG: phosphonopyruvate decarboxylase [Spirochaetaceae bacterium]|jgi:phosphonopyruvate decarboxylase|nr:phosphonopyruvate decarboxylase [Spirochaetaceae bacterium]